MGTTITVTASDGFELDGFLAAPSGRPRAGVVIVQEIFGVNIHIREVAEAFAAEGYLALAPAVFDRLERGVELGYTADDIVVGRDLARVRTDFSRAVGDIEDSAATLRTLLPGGAKVGCVGYCWGGVVSCAAAVAVARRVDAAVSYYGTGTVGQVDRPLHAPLLCHFGDQDESIPPADIDTMRQGWPTAEIHTYPAQHGFNCNHRAQYDAASRELAWSRTVAFLGRHLA